MKEQPNNEHKSIIEWIDLSSIFEKLQANDIELLYLLKQGQEDFENNDSSGMVLFWSKYQEVFTSDYLHKYNTGEIYRNNIVPYQYHQKIKEIFRQKLKEKYLYRYTHVINPIRDYIFMRMYRSNISFD
jgi:hypothetical protein